MEFHLNDWQYSASWGDEFVYEQPLGNGGVRTLHVNKNTGQATEWQNGNVVARGSVADWSAADPKSDTAGPSPAAAATSGPRSSGSPTGGINHPDPTRSRSENALTNHTSANLVKQVKDVNFDGRSGLTEDIFSDGKIAYHDKNGAIVARSTEAFAPSVSHPATSTESGESSKPSTIYFLGSGNGPAPHLSATDLVSEHGGGMGAAPAVDSSLNLATDEQVHPYSGGAKVETVKPLANGGTLTTTATGAEIETTAAGNSYVAKAAPLQVSNDVSPAVTEHRHAFEDLGTPAASNTAPAPTASQPAVTPSATVEQPTTPAVAAPAPEPSQPAPSVSQAVEDHRHLYDDANSSPPVAAAAAPTPEYNPAPTASLPAAPAPEPSSSPIVSAPAAPAPEPQPTVPPAVTLPAPSASDTPSSAFGGFDTNPNIMHHGRQID